MVLDILSERWGELVEGDPRRWLAFARIWQPLEGDVWSGVYQLVSEAGCVPLDLIGVLERVH